jgi:cobalt-zinc-cadmium efflux system membrane fusion protein
MSQVHVGEYADIHLVAYPDRVLKARISNILPTIDPNIRTAKVRLEVDNPDLMRLEKNNFCHRWVSNSAHWPVNCATFHGLEMARRATVPSTAILHLHDREWVYVPLGNGRFRRLEVTAGSMLPGSLQEVVSGVKPGDRVILNALVFQNTVEQ